MNSDQILEQRNSALLELKEAYLQNAIAKYSAIEFSSNPNAYPKGSSIEESQRLGAEYTLMTEEFYKKISESNQAIQGIEAKLDEIKKMYRSSVILA